MGLQPPEPAATRAWWPIAVYPVAFPLSYVLVLWGQAEVSVLELVRPATVAALIALAVTLVASLLAGERRLGGLAASAACVALVVDRPDASLLLVALAVLVVVIGRIPGGRAIRFLPAAVRLLQAIAAIALVAAVVSLVTRPGFVPVIQEAFLPPPGPRERPDAPADARDVFVYLIDGYPGATASAQAPAFDASALPTALRDRGFVVHDDARTNYLITRLVVPTLFEGRHVGDLPQLAAPFGPDQAVDARRLRSVTEHADGFAAIRAAGYDVVWISSGFSHMDIRNVDRWIEAPGPSELEVAILRQTGLGTLLQAIDPNGFSEVMRSRIRAAYEHASAVASTRHDRPRFVFVHVPAPHPPTVLRADGSAEDGSPDAAWDTFVASEESADLRRERTFAQVKAIDRLTIDGVDAVRAASAVDPVIVLFSDHGTDVGFDPNDAIGSDLDERTSTILAALTPGRPGLFDEPTTPVNIIRTLTNAYMGTELGKQPDTTFAYRESVLDVVPMDPTPGD